MKNWQPLFYLITLSLLISCGDNSVHSEFDKDFPDNRWQRNDVRSFDFTLEKAGSYDLAIDFSHVYGMPFKAVPLTILLKSPDGANEVHNINLALSDDNGKVLSDCAGDYCDLRQTFLRNKQLPAGNYTISIKNEFDHEYLPNIFGVGIGIFTSGEDQ
ncbi:MAG TPA: hypothetical protein VGB44_07255 [Flavobacterium sp.]|jgi:gliding motility-associated lipoprotein GldH